MFVRTGKVECSCCEGKGEITVEYPTWDDYYYFDVRPCPDCGGWGMVCFNMVESRDSIFLQGICVSEAVTDLLILAGGDVVNNVIHLPEIEKVARKPKAYHGFLWVALPA